MEKTTSGWVNGFVGVAIFAGSLPATRVAVAEFDPTFLTCARATIAAVLGLALLLLLRQPRPKVADLPALALTATGVVVGFPLLTALALQHVSSAHSTVFIGLLPLCTAIFAVIRGGERAPTTSVLGVRVCRGRLRCRIRGAGWCGILAARQSVHACRHYCVWSGLR